MGMWGSDPSFIEEHQVLLSTEPSPQPNIGVSFKIACIYNLYMTVHYSHAIFSMERNQNRFLINRVQSILAINRFQSSNLLPTCVIVSMP